jgi:hypothetical protein
MRGNSQVREPPLSLVVESRLTLSPSKSKWARKITASFMGTSSFLYKIWKTRLCTVLSWTQAECRLLLSAKHEPAGVHKLQYHPTPTVPAGVCPVWESPNPKIYCKFQNLILNLLMSQTTSYQDLCSLELACISEKLGSMYHKPYESCLWYGQCLWTEILCLLNSSPVHMSPLWILA